MTLLRSTLALLLCSASGAAAADELGAEASVFDDGSFITGASRRRQTLESAPASITVVSAEEIRRFGWRTITDVLANVRGFYVTDDKNYSYVGVRGFARPGDYNSRLLVLINGHALHDSTYFGTLLGQEFPVDMDLVERIEVIRGPVSALYGTNALLAVVNVVTRTGPDVRQLDGVGFNTSLEGDSLRRGKGALRYDQIHGDWRFVFSASGEMTRGQSYIWPELGLSGPTAPKSDASRTYNIYGAVAYKQLTVQGGTNSRRKMVPTASFNSLAEAGEETTDGRTFLEAALDFDLAPATTLDARIFLDRSHYDGMYPYAEEDGGWFYDTADGTSIGGDLMLQLEPTSWSHLAVGVFGQRAFDLNQTFALPAMNDFSIDRRAYWTAALFGDLDLKYKEWATLSVGARFDHYETFGNHISPRLALVLTPGAGTSVKLVHGQAFRAPNIYELYYDDALFSANPDLKPEFLTHWEIAMAKTVLDGQGEFSLGLFHYRIQGLIAPVLNEETGIHRFENVEAAEARGFDAQIKAQLPWLGISAIAAYTLTLTSDGEGERQLSNSPEHLLNGRLLLPLYNDRMFLAVAGRFISRRAGVLPERLSAPSSFLTDVTYTWDNVLPGLDLGIGVSNLFDAEWSAPSSVEHTMSLIPQDRRTAWAKLSYTF